MRVLPRLILAGPALALWALAAVQIKQPEDDDGQAKLLNRIWQGVQAAQNKFESACGTITETRTSKIFAKPKTFRGTFCAEGLGKFNLEYSEPETVRLRFSIDYLNVTTRGADGLRTEVVEIGQHVRRTQSYFSGETSLRNLKENFTISVREAGTVYEMRLEPRAQRFASRINYLIVRLDKADFALRALEVDGRSGVRSVFLIELTSRNTKLDEGMFRVYRP